MDLGGPDLRIRLSGVIISTLNLALYNSFHNVLGHKVKHSEQTSQIFWPYHLKQSFRLVKQGTIPPQNKRNFPFYSLKTTFPHIAFIDNLTIFLIHFCALSFVSASDICLQKLLFRDKI